MSKQRTKLLPGVLFAATLAFAPAAIAADAAGARGAQAEAQGGTTEETAQLSRAGRDFVKKAAMGNRAELRMGELAMRNAASEEVREFGRRLVDDHSKAAADLKDAVQDERIAMADELDAKHQRELERLSKLSGKEFDREFAKKMVKDHEKEVAMFRKAAEQLEDPQLKRFAETTLPELEHHLSRARELAKNVGGAS